MRTLDKYFEEYTDVNGYTIIKMIGQGTYGIAYLAIDRNGEKFVVKQFKKEKLKHSRTVLDYEISVLNELDDPRFPKFITEFKDRYREGYILKYIEGCTIRELIERDKPTFSKGEIYDFATKLFDLVEILHNSNIVHRDIRIPNIIVNSKRELCLIDFGVAKYLDNERYSKQEDYLHIGTVLINLYYSPIRMTVKENREWDTKLDLTDEERIFLKRLIGINKKYESIYEIREQLEKIKKQIN